MLKVNRKGFVSGQPIDFFLLSEEIEGDRPGCESCEKAYISPRILLLIGNRRRLDPRGWILDTDAGIDAGMQQTWG